MFRSIELVVRTSAQAEGLIKSEAFPKQVVAKLLTRIAEAGTIDSVISVASRLTPSQAILLASRTHEMSCEQAGILLYALTATEPYGDVRRELLDKFLRQPISRWVKANLRRMLVDRTNLEHDVLRSEFVAMIDVVIRSGSSEHMHSLVYGVGGIEQFSLDERRQSGVRALMAASTRRQ